jgi:hypothetical protein
LLEKEGKAVVFAKDAGRGLSVRRDDLGSCPRLQALREETSFLNGLIAWPA